MRDPFVPDALAERLRTKRRNTRPVAALTCEPARPVFAELLDGRGHGTGQFVRLSQGMVERIARVVRQDGVRQDEVRQDGVLQDGVLQDGVRDAEV